MNFSGKSRQELEFGQYGMRILLSSKINETRLDESNKWRLQ